MTEGCGPLNLQVPLTAKVPWSPFCVQVADGCGALALHIMPRYVLYNMMGEIKYKQQVGGGVELCAPSLVSNDQIPGPGICVVAGCCHLLQGSVGIDTWEHTRRFCLLRAPSQLGSYQTVMLHSQSPVDVCHGLTGQAMLLRQIHGLSAGDAARLSSAQHAVLSCALVRCRSGIQDLHPACWRRLGLVQGLQPGQPRGHVHQDSIQ